MATNFTQNGDRLTLTAPAGGVESGKLYVVNGLAVVALGNAAAGDEFVGLRRGIYTVAKTAPLVLAQGAQLFLAEAGTVGDTTTDTYVGVAAEAAAEADTTVPILLTPDIAPDLVALLVDLESRVEALEGA